jgi:hypothetical protein
VGTNPQALVTADLNNDGAPDLVTANLGTYNSATGTFAGGGVSVLLGLRDHKGRPTGAFGAAQNYAVGSCASVAVGLIDSGSALDIVTGSGAVLLGNGDGTFRIGASYSGGLGGYITVADLNGDGARDLITAALATGVPGTNYGYDRISVLLGNGDGTFRAGATYTTATYLVAVAVGNFDGKLDIITGTNTNLVDQGNGPVQAAGTVTLSLLPGNGDGTFGAARTITSFTQSDLEGLAVGDFNGDHKLDLAYASAFYGPSAGPYSPTATILLGNSDGTFPFAPAGGGIFTAVLAGTSVGLAADGSGKLIMVGTPGGRTSGTVVDLLTNLGTVEQGFTDFGAVSSPTAFTVGDFNGDGYADVAIVGATSSGGYAVDVLLWNAKHR